MYAFSNRKKLRGAKRQLGRVERWRQAHLSPDLRHLDLYGYDYVKLTIDPWDRLVKRQPPVWLRREMTHALLDMYESWHEATRDNAEVSYLRVWLSWPEFTASQVVVSTSLRAAYYEGMFVDVEQPRGLPADLGAPLLERLAQFEWREVLNEYPVNVEDLRGDNGHIDWDDVRRWLSKRKYRREVLPDGTTIYWLQYGRTWVGSKREVDDRTPSRNAAADLADGPHLT